MDKIISEQYWASHSFSATVELFADNNAFDIDFKYFFCVCGWQNLPIN